MKSNGAVMDMHNGIEGTDGITGFDDDAGLFENFTLGRLLKRFAKLDIAAGYGPLTPGRGYRG